MNLLIDREGKAVGPCTNALDVRIWNQGFFHIEKRTEDTILVTLQPALVGLQTLSSGFKQLRKLEAMRIVLFTTRRHDEVRIFASREAALSTIVILSRACRRAFQPRSAVRDLLSHRAPCPESKVGKPGARRLAAPPCR